MSPGGAAAGARQHRLPARQRAQPPPHARDRGRGPALARRGQRAMLAELVESIEGTRTLAILNYRPEYSPPWVGADGYRQISLEPLREADTAELLRDLAGEDPSLDGLAEPIHGRTARQPVLHRGDRPRAGRDRATARGAGRLPPGAADRGRRRAGDGAGDPRRTDRPARRRAKQLLQVASVVGKEFGERALRLTAGMDARGDRPGALRADRGRLPLRSRALPGTGARLPPPADPRGRLRDPARRPARSDPCGGGAGDRSSSSPSA